MALVSCPECGCEISDRALSCPKCGFPLNETIGKDLNRVDDEERELDETSMVKCRFCGYANIPHDSICKKCGREIAVRCPVCDSNKILFQREQTANLGMATNRVVIEEGRRSKGCLYWLFIGWWLEPLKFFCFGWMKLIFGGGKRAGFNINASKSLNRTIAVCQNCGNSWKV